MNQRAGRWLLLFGTLIFALLGQLYFAKRPNYFWDGVAFYAIAGLCFILLVRSPASTAASNGEKLTRRTAGEWARLVLAALGITLSLAAVVQLLRPHENYWPVFWLWIAGMMLVLLAALPRPRLIYSGLAGVLRGTDWWEAAAVFAIVAAALALRAWRVDTIPWTLSGDEGNFGRWARQVLSGEVNNMFATGHLSMPSLYAFYQAGWLRLAGDNMFGLRLPWAIMGTLSVFGAYLLVRRLFGRTLALTTGVLLAGYSYHLHYSRLALNNIADPFFVVFALYFLVVGWQGGRKWAWTVSGLFAGLALYFYTGGRQVPVILAALLIWIALIEPGFLRKHRSGLTAMLLAFLVTVGPMALFAVQHPDDFNARINQVGIIQSGWLDTVAQMESKSKVMVLLEQFRRVFFAFNHFLDRTDFYKPSTPLLDFPMSVLFLLGVILSLVRIRMPERPPDHGRPALPAWRYAVFVVWFFGVIVAGGVLTDSAPSSQRILSSSIPAAFFVALALYELVKVFGNLTLSPRAVVRGVALVIAIVLAVGSVRYYFGPYQESRVYGSFNGEVSTAIGYYMRDLGPEWKQYFMGAPRMWAEFGSATFISRNPYLDVIEPLAGPLTFVDPGYNAAFIVLPERESDLVWLQQAYPQGELERVHRSGESDGQVLFTAYKVLTKTS